MKGTISYNLGENILFDNFRFGDSFLLLNRGGGRWRRGENHSFCL